MEWVLGVVASIITAFFTARFAAQREQARLHEELKLDYSVEAAIHQLLAGQGWKRRSFSVIRYHIRGFKDDELRQHLVKAGAIAFKEGGIEWWGLLELNRDRLTRNEEEIDE